MPLSDSEIRSFQATDKRQKASCGDSLYLVVEPVQKGGGKSFIAKTRFPPGRQGKWVEVRIGKYGKGVGRMSLKQARDEWRVIRAWSQENGKDPRDRKREAKDALVEQATLTTFEQACEAYLTSWSGANDKGKKEYRNILWNQVLPEFGAETPIEHLSWDYRHPNGKTSREWFVEFIGKTRNRAPSTAEKMTFCLKGTFDCAVHRGWVERGHHPAQNLTSPAERKQRVATTQSDKHLKWNELSEFFETHNANAPNGDLITRGALLLILMTGARVAAVAGLRWSEVDEEQSVLRIPSDRMKTWTPGEVDHLVPLSGPMLDLLERMGKVSGGEEFVFPGRKRGGQAKHLNNSVPNNHLIALGYKDRLQAHGMRSTVRTLGQEVCRFPDLICGLNGGWKMRDKIRGIYDRHDHMEERRAFMTAWSDALLEAGMEITSV